MSSLAAARADNFYFPPEWRPEMGGISKFQGSKGANQYEQYGIIRYELPFDAWCLKCNRHMCKGLRFNAKKDKIGKYFSTTLYSFTMKCYNCQQQFVIKTDPEHRSYDFAEGLRKMEQDFTPDEGDSLLQTTSEEVKEALVNDPMFRLQYDKEGKIKADIAKGTIEDLIDLKDVTTKNDIDANRLLRRKHRTQKHRDEELRLEAKAIGIGFPLVEPSPSDTILAQKVNFNKRGRLSSFQISERSRFAALQSEPIFKYDKNNSVKKGNMKWPKETINMSSEAVKHRRINDAMQKQAQINIDTSSMKVTEHTEAYRSQILISRKPPAVSDTSTQLLHVEINPTSNNCCNDSLANKTISKQESRNVDILFGLYGGDSDEN